MTTEGILVIQAQRFRSQPRNREDAIERLVELVRNAARPPKVRTPTKPSLAAKRKRVEEKKKRAIIKSHRRAVRDIE